MLHTIIVSYKQVLFEVQALGNFTGEEDGDLSFKEREILAILESRYIYWHIQQDNMISKSDVFDSPSFVFQSRRWLVSGRECSRREGPYSKQLCTGR